MRFQTRPAFLLLAAVFLAASTISPANAQEPAPFANCRLGIGGAYAPYVGDFDITPLNIGLYLDWWNNSDPQSNLGLPGDVEYIQIVRVHQDKVGGWDSAYVRPPTYSVAPSLVRIAEIADSQPGSLWLIGNEVERRDWNGGGQDEITPELYARAFHEIRDAIKAADPSARIGIGSVIEATPLRLAYLDRVWDSYFRRYGHSMGDDIDVWNIHGFLLREVRHSYGAEIPAGLDNEDANPNNDYNPEDGFLYGADIATIVAEHHNVLRYIEFTRALRQWMAAHGERNKPLINTEMGLLSKRSTIMQITTQQFKAYLTASFDFMLTATDDEIGYPADENRLVQGWVWYSLNDDGWRGNLFDPSTKALTAIGTHWKNYVANPGNPPASQPMQNLLVTNLRASPNPTIAAPGQDATVTLRVDVANSGNTRTDTNNHIVVSFWDGDPEDPGSNRIGSPQILDDLSGCGRFTTVEIDPQVPGVGDHVWYAKVNVIANETSVTDNTASSVVSVMESLPDADLEVVMAVDEDEPRAGDLIRYFITLRNNGPDGLTDIVVNDVLPDGVSFNSYAATQGVYYTVGEWWVGPLASGAEAVLTITARVDNGPVGQSVTNTASISAARNDRVPANDEDSVTIIRHRPPFILRFPVILKRNPWH